MLRRMFCSYFSTPSPHQSVINSLPTCFIFIISIFLPTFCFRQTKTLPSHMCCVCVVCYPKPESNPICKTTTHLPLFAPFTRSHENLIQIIHPATRSPSSWWHPPKVSNHPLVTFFPKVWVHGEKKYLKLSRIVIISSNFWVLILILLVFLTTQISP